MHPCVALLWLPFVTASGALAAAPNDEHGADHPPPVEAVVFRDALSDGLPGPYMVIIPAGEFLMGDPYAGSNRNSAPPHAVRIRRAFAMGRFEVTFAEYDRFAVAAGFPRPDDAGTGRGERPVMNVTWDEAAAYTMWLSEQTGVHYHLPSESQWEYAAAAGARTRYSFGDDVGRICRHANVGDASAFRKYAYFT
jgi:formylglycine-generating enzyme required for sulfatase activity